MFLDYMSRGFSLGAFSRIFSTNKVKNDKIVRRYYKKLKYVKRKRHCKKNSRGVDYEGAGNSCTTTQCMQTCTARFGCYL